MRKYHMQDRAGLEPKYGDEVEQTLLNVCEMCNWTSEEFDEIASMEVGEEKEYDSVWIKRTE